MSCSNITSITLAELPMWFQATNALIATVGTILISILAIWGDWIRIWFTGPKLSVSLQDDVNGMAVPLSNGDLGVFVLLVVNNQHPVSVAKNCIIQIEAIEKKSMDGGFYPLYVARPLQLIWSPAESNIQTQTIFRNAIADLGRVTKSKMKFEPQIRHRPHNFNGTVAPDETVRYSVRVYAENACPSKLFVFEVAWNGKWSDKLSEMYNHLKIRAVSAT